MRRIVLIRPDAGGGNIRFRGAKWFAVLRAFRQARIVCDQKAARMFGPVRERKAKREPFGSFGMEWLLRRASRAASPEEAGRERRRLRHQGVLPHPGLPGGGWEGGSPGGKKISGRALPFR